MAPAGRAVVVVALSLLYLCRAIFSTEFFSALTFAEGEHGCGPPSEWEEYAADCETAVLQLEDPDCEEGSSPPCESVFSLNAEKILSQARLFVEQRRFPFPVDDHNTNEELAIGYVLIGNGLYDEAIKHFSLLLQGDPELVSAMYGRGIAYGKKSLQDIKNADLALYELSRVITLEPNRPEVYEQRAEILSPLGRISEALSDLTKAIQLQPSARLYRHRGTLLFISEVHTHAASPHSARDEAIETFKEALKLKSDFIDAHKSLAQAYRELGDFDNAMESFQKALLLNQNHLQSLQLRGMMLYHHGSLQDAIGNFKRCLQLEPYNEVCQYMKGLSHVAMGQFYEGIKAQTKVMLNDPLLGQKASSEYLKVKYLREYSRYLHSHLDIPVAEYNVDQDLPGNFKNHWAKNLPFLIEDYEEQPGLQPHIKDVLPQDFESYSPDVQKLICTADHLGSLMQYNTSGFLPNLRIQRAMGLATIEVMQAMHRTWSNSKVRVNGKTRQLQWRDMFDIAVKWRRIADPDQPVLWLDQMPARSLSRGFNNHINLIRAYNPRGLQEVKQALENVNKVEDLLPIMKVKHSKCFFFFFLPSCVCFFTSSVGNMLFSVETQTTEERTQQYQSEIEALYKDLTAKGKALMLSSELGDADAVCNLILSLVYYFCNLMPLSRGSSIVAYSVVMGALMASGKEVVGRVPSGKLELKTYFDSFSPSWYPNLPSVAETFQFSRTMIEVLNTDSSSRCPKKS
uniref:Tetratricopeptide repeat domain 13 n=1 Tax=Pygocentrus nattereri TaxID=42514 RepID=A0A3B4D3K0_PYGNA